MCGRYTITAPGSVLDGLVDDPRADALRASLRPRYNVAPTQSAPVVRRGATGRELAALRWGLVPARARDAAAAARLINARAETVLDRGAFRDSLARQRCLVPADGFFEWRADPRQPRRRRPFFAHLPGRRPFAFAGLWAAWHPPGGGPRLETFTILTTEPTALLRTIHDRMPLVLRPAEQGLWLEGGAGEVAAWLAELPPREGIELEVEPVSTRVNSVAEDDAALLDRVPGDEPAADAGASAPQLALF